MKKSIKCIRLLIMLLCMMTVVGAAFQGAAAAEPDVDTAGLWISDDGEHYVEVTDTVIKLDSVKGESLKLYAFSPDGSEVASWKTSNTAIATVAGGLVTAGQKTGKAKITATFSGPEKQTASVTISVVNKVQEDSIVIEGPEEVVVGKTIRLSVSFDQYPQPSIKSVNWKSDDPDIALVSGGTVTGVSGGYTIVTACSVEDNTICGSKSIKVTPLTESVTILDGDSIELDIAGVNTYSLTAIVKPDDADQTVTWKSNNSAVAVVDENGEVTVLRAGTATITATAADGSGKSDSIIVKSTSKVQEDSIVIEGPEEVYAGKTIRLSVTFDQKPQPTNKRVVWESYDTDIATVSNGTVSGVSRGRAEIVACAEENPDICSSFTVKVLPRPAVTITDGDDPIELDLAGESTYPLTALVEPEEWDQTVTWKSSNLSVATVDKNGLVTGLRAGSATITATAKVDPSLTDTIVVNVASKVQEDSIVISGPGQVAVGKTIPLTVSFDQNPQPTNKNVVWVSYDPDIATVIDGTVTGVKKGSAEIVACAEENTDICGSFPVEVLPKPALRILDGDDPIELDLAGESTYPLTALVEPEEWDQTVTWKSSNLSVATVDKNGLVTGLRAGSATITATAEVDPSLTDTIVVNVTSKVQEDSIVISGPGQVAVGKTIPLTVSFDQDPQPTNTNVVWESYDPAIAAVSVDGIVTGVSRGSAEIVACAQDDPDVCGSFPVEVLPRPALTIIAEDDPIELDLAGENEYQLMALVEPEEWDQEVTWKSSPITIATVDEDGLVTGLRAGEVTITATSKADPSLEDSIVINVTSKVQEGSIKIDGPDQVAVGQTIQLTMTFDQDPQPTEKDVNWECPDEEIAEVSSDGAVTGLSRGNAEIRACSVAYPDICGSYMVEVLPRPEVTIITDDDPIEIDLAGENEYQLAALVIPEEWDQTVIWKSGNTRFAAVDETGLVTGVRAGSTTITATAKVDPSLKDTINVTVVSKVQEDGMSIEGPDEVLSGKTIKLTVTFDQTPQPTNKEVIWTSLDEDIATVSNGNVKGVSGGSAEIRACSKAYPDICATHTVEVIPYVESVMITDEEDDTQVIELSEKITYQLGVVVTPDNAMQDVIWKSSNTKIATVNENGLVTGLRAGNVNITATAADGSKRFDTITISVKYTIPVDGNLGLNGPDDVAIGKTIRLVPVFDEIPELRNKPVIWTTSNSDIAKVSRGVVTGVSEGEATIEVCVKDYSICADKVVHVYPIALGVSIVDEDDGSLLIDLASDKQTYDLSAHVHPEGASQAVTWRSSNPRIADVSPITLTDDGEVIYGGLVVGMNPGTVTITASTADGSKKSASVKITVTSKVQPGSIVIEGSNAVLVKRTVSLKASFDQTVQPSNKQIIWGSDDTSVAKVSNGRVTGVSEGSVTITACSKENLAICTDWPMTVYSINSKSMDTAAIDADPENISSPVSDETGAAAPDGAVKDNAAAFDQEEIVLHIGESRKLDVTDPDGNMIVLSAAEPVVLWDEAVSTVTGLTEGEVTAYLADMKTVDILDTMTIRVTAVPAEEPEAAPVTVDEDLPAENEEPEAESEAKKETASEIGFTQKELTVEAGDSIVLEVSNPDGAAVFVGLSGDTDAVLWDGSFNMVTGIRAGDVTAFLSLVDPFEVKDLCEIHVVEKAGPVQAEEETPETEEGGVNETEPTETPTETDQQPVVTEVPDEPAPTETPVPEGPDTETGEEIGNDPVVTEQPEMPEETTAPEEEDITLQIRDLGDEGLTGTAGETLRISRDRFDADDELYLSLSYQVENEALVWLPVQSEAERLTDGLTLQLLAEGNTVLKIRKGSEEKTVLEIRIEVLPAAAAEPVVPEETNTETVDQVTETGDVIPEMTEPQPTEIPTEEPDAESVPEMAEEPAVDTAEDVTPEPEPEPEPEPVQEEVFEEADAGE